MFQVYNSGTNCRADSADLNYLSAFARITSGRSSRRFSALGEWPLIYKDQMVLVICNAFMYSFKPQMAVFLSKTILFKSFYSFIMAISTNRSLGIQKNKLLRYKLIKELYQKHKTEDIPTTVVWRKYIYPVYPISRTTLYEILCTPITSELKKIEELLSNQTKNL